jgi:hypothetical protein
MWSRSAVCGPLDENVGRLDKNMGLGRDGLAANLVPFCPCLWSRALLLVGRYSYQVARRLSENQSVDVIGSELPDGR